VILGSVGFDGERKIERRGKFWSRRKSGEAVRSRMAAQVRAVGRRAGRNDEKDGES